VRQRTKLAKASLATLITLGLLGCQARQPGPLETSLVQKVKRNITVRGNDVANPLPGTEENIRAGQASFSNYCMVCHGLDGQNTGVPFAERMSPPVPDLKSSAAQAYSDGQLKWIIDNGIFPSGMPASKGTLNDDEIWQIVHYLRHLPLKGSLGEPQVYGGAPRPSGSR
jgi:mono/diheme cytochrome c family protein